MVTETVCQAPVSAWSLPVSCQVGSALLPPSRVRTLNHRMVEYRLMTQLLSKGHGRIWVLFSSLSQWVEHQCQRM